MRTLQEALVCIINSSEGRDYLRKRDLSMALVGGPLGQAYFLEFLCLLSTITPGQALECAHLTYPVG